MYKLYERVGKSEEYLRGSKEVEPSKNPFLEGPCLLCISAQHDNPMAARSNFGITKTGMKMARLRTKGEVNAGFDIEDFPVKFLSMQLDKSDEEGIVEKETRVEDFLNRYFVPLISNDEHRIDCVQAMKNMRNVNLVTYCDGTLLAQYMEYRLMTKMKELGYTEEECEQIQSQMFMMPIATDRLHADQKSTCISFKDINDYEVNDTVTQEEQDLVDASPIGQRMFSYADNEYAYMFSGDGRHSLKNYTKNGEPISVCVSSVLSKALENSIQNSKGNYTPITGDLLISDLSEIEQRLAEGVSAKELMSNLDTALQYDGARRISDREAKLLDKLDASYDKMLKMQSDLDSTKRSLETKAKNERSLIAGIRENCSDMTRLKLMLSIGWQLGLGEGVTRQEVMNAPSDRQLVEEYKGSTKKPMEFVKTFTNDIGKKFDIYIDSSRDDLCYLLAFPEHFENGAKLVVESYNSGGKQKPTYKENVINALGKNNIENLLAEAVTDAPIVMPIVPDLLNRPDSQQLSRDSIMEQNIAEKFLHCIEDAKVRVEEMTGKKLDDKIFLHGYSASGVFAQRFALIHPEIIDRCLIGGAAGTIPIPTDEIDYPIGVRDYKELFGKDFDFETYKKIGFGYYVAENEANEPGEYDINGEKIENDSQIAAPMHDISYRGISTEREVGKAQREKMGETLDDRFKNTLEFYKTLGIDVSSIILRDASHKEIFNGQITPTSEYLKQQILLFYYRRAPLVADTINCTKNIQMSFQDARNRHGEITPEQK